jgi:hypothetical protein
MRPLTAAISCLLVALWTACGICDEPTRQSDISFAIPFVCSKPGASGPFGIERKALCLGGSYRAGLTVALVGEPGVLYTKTADSCAHSDHLGSCGDADRTYLVGSEAYLALEEKEMPSSFLHRFRVAIVGTDSVDVRLCPPTEDQLPGSTNMEWTLPLFAHSFSDPCQSTERLYGSPVGQHLLHTIYRTQNPLTNLRRDLGSIVLRFSINDQPCIMYVPRHPHPIRNPPSTHYPYLYVYNLSTATPQQIFRGILRPPESAFPEGSPYFPPAYR